MTDEKLEEPIRGRVQEATETALVARRPAVRVDEEALTEWIANCDPYTPIGPDDERYFDFARLSEDGIDLRGVDHIAKLYTGITRSGEQSCQLFSGFSGTGKSTELRRLKHLLEAAGYSVLLVDARRYHDLNHPLTAEDLTVILAGAFGEATAELLGRDVHRQSYWQRLLEFLKRPVEEVTLRAAIMDLKIGVKHAKPFWAELREALAASPGKLRRSSHDFIRNCVTQITGARKDAPKVVFIVDSLERLGTSSLDFDEMMESIIQVFTESADDLRLPECHVIYAIPPYVQLIHPKLGDYYTRVSLVLPAIKVVERGVDLVPFRPGIEALGTLLGRRVPLDRIFGERREALERLVIYSGGHVRTLLVFLRELLFNASPDHFPLQAGDVEQAVQPFREQATQGVWREIVPLLNEILHSGTLKNVSKEEFASLAECMDAYIVLCYRNGEGWYEVHPLVRAYVRELAEQRAALERQEARPEQE